MLRSSAARWDIQDHEGGQVSLGVGGPLTGRGADCLIVDDPVKNSEEANSASQREKVWSWFQSTAYTRLEPGASIVIVMARWHEDDLVGRLLNSEDDWTIISLPAIAEADDILGRHEGEPLWRERYSLDELESIKRTVGSYTWAALYQGSPVPAGGHILQRSWFRYWREKDKSFPPVAVRLPDGETVEHHAIELPDSFDEVIQSWDLSFKRIRNQRLRGRPAVGTQRRGSVSTRSGASADGLSKNHCRTQAHVRSLAEGTKEVR